MASLRKNLFSGEWVVIAEDTSFNLEEFRLVKKDHFLQNAKNNKDCFFCSLEKTTLANKEVLVVKNPENEKEWLVKVIKDDLLQDETFKAEIFLEFYTATNNFGRIETIIESPKHYLGFDEMTIQEIKEVLRVYQKRLISASKNSQIKYYTIIKSQNFETGKIYHSHSKLYAFPFLPNNVENIIINTRDYFKKRKHCIFCRTIDQELIEKRYRVCSENLEFISINLHASKFPFETYIFPKKHRASFLALRDDELDYLAQALKSIVYKINKVLNYPKFDLYLNTLPLNYRKYLDLHHSYHWHFQLVPRLNDTDSISLASNIFFNKVKPEMAAEALQAIPDIRS